MNLVETINQVNYAAIKIKNFFQTTDFIISKGVKTLNQATVQVEEQVSKTLLPPLSTNAILNHLDQLAVLSKELLPVMVLLSVRHAYEDGDKEELEYFITEFLKLKYSSNLDRRGDRIEALWIAIGRVPKWTEGKGINVEALSHYLRKSVIHDTEKIKKDRERADKLSKHAEILLEENYDIFEICLSSKTLFTNPLNLLMIKEFTEGISQAVMNNLNTPQEEKIIQLLLKGGTPKDCVELLNCEYHHIQSIQQKLKRRIEYKNKLAF